MYGFSQKCPLGFVIKNFNQISCYICNIRCKFCCVDTKRLYHVHMSYCRQIEVDLAEIKQALRKLQRQFSNQFAPAVSAEDLTTMQQSIIEQSSLERIAESVKRAQLTEYPDQLGKRVINTGVEFKGKNEAQKYNLLLQILHEQDWKARCKEVSQGQPLPPLVPLSDHDLTVKRLHLKTLGRMVKHDIIDKDYPAASKEWKNIPEKNREYYMMHLERLAKNGRLHIHQYKRMWCARSLLWESFKSDNQTHKRRIAEKNKTQQDIGDSSLSSPDMSETSDVEAPIMADVLSPLLSRCSDYGSDRIDYLTPVI
ncbi:hypothetical protein PHYBLDRAFT_161914 [Phycomyces blakesleeanus NRRL 1555(-)]|uniref:Uncharacterized protein n=1 Tax=Phycomyces blakesleeanus (strain ATCC 8743b / DSM 1359 / FGSC 10004 / NBRC 33097 / NRRL 1555) TaxID=763407 RepID=A0A167RBR1_PHYB8|nr:hypothetical protein PHYBLDRAFT_161914 [Phycomyces blakesleeanus NRRL 1555(-)]OAD81299.1 hypothetical protein PHYBLDRAFT_161914 [Phycomyces blakesleeanus NRRL 1555(-)]|eukprot:XP_018299339.1 hypothetical protein PHYBLDRAFT_161914 [Phycomyces blakesleeanus NRRL 1555(-)]